MKIARVIGTVTLNRRDSRLVPGKLLLCEALDLTGMTTPDGHVDRKLPMPESLVVYDHLGAGVGCIIAIGESGEAARPFMPLSVPVDAYCAAILDNLEVDPSVLQQALANCPA